MDIQLAGIILACAMCAMAHTFQMRRTEIWSVRRDGAQFSKMVHENLTCAPLFIEVVTFLWKFPWT